MYSFYFSLCVNIIFHVFMLLVIVSFVFPCVPVLCLLVAFLLLSAHQSHREQVWTPVKNFLSLHWIRETDSRLMRDLGLVWKGEFVQLTYNDITERDTNVCNTVGPQAPVICTFFFPSRPSCRHCSKLIIMKWTDFWHWVSTRTYLPSHDSLF